MFSSTLELEILMPSQQDTLRTCQNDYGRQWRQHQVLVRMHSGWVTPMLPMGV